MAEIASGERLGFVGEGCRLPWHAGVVQLPVIDPVPVYPCSLLYHRQNRHPMLTALVEFVADGFRQFDPARQWMPDLDRVTAGGL
ncbi:hypothetical protein ACQEUU_03150 [Nonomuraea sp. CA-218870]|uniref:hypothetical protein n=1 Tax=Nonomuraea sp. CA-218870 TaxID=3239998 RepID=UPI003D8D2E69